MPYLQYAELQCKTNFSFLRGASHPHELVERAIELGIRALAITDHDGVYGLPKAYLAIKDQRKILKRFRLLSGVDLKIQDHPRLTLLVRDRKAYGLMCRIITAAHANKPKGEGVLTREELSSFMEQRASQGLIALSRWGSDFPFLKERFGQRLYYTVSQFLDGRDSRRLQVARQIQKSYDIFPVATNDVHYHHPDRRRLQDIVTGVREGKGLSSLGYRLFSNAERYLKSPARMHQLFRDLPEAIQNGLDIAESCPFSLSELRYHYPSEWIPEGETAQSFLRKLVEKGVKWRYPQGASQKVLRQIEHELRLIEELRFADYFLTIWDIVEFAKRAKILCQGRGSAATSVVCYCLGITAVDPVHMDLLFERFISAERGEPPDIDVDFEHERREEVIQYIYEKYGRDRAAMVSAVITYRSRSAVREVSKVFGREIDRDELERQKSQKGFYAQVCRYSKELKGFPRHLSIHSGGFILSSDPIIETVPVEPARMEGRTIIQWDKYDLDALDLLKIDVLALGMLTAIRKCMDLVGGLTLATLPQEDRKTYAMIQRADTVGVFQIESRAQMNMLGRLQPKSYYDLVIEVALVRPGPIVGKMVHPYLRRRRGLDPIVYHHPKLKKILGKTLGVPIFQEQVMKMAIELADFTPGDADRLRKAIGAWRSSGSIEKMGQRLMDGLLRNGLPPEFVQNVFQQIKGFAEYGFPESHSASFALLAYASSYLKCHYPAEFACALINSQPMGFYANHSLIDDAKRHGAEVRPVDPNYSGWDCHMEEGALRLGFRLMKGFGEEQAQALVRNRDQEGPFLDLTDFLKRSFQVGLRRDHLETLALGNAFQRFGLDERHSLWQILAYDTLNLRPSSGQLGLFSDLQSEIRRQRFRRLDAFGKIQTDYSSFGVSTRGHPMEALRRKLLGLPYLRSKHLKLGVHNQWVTTCGLVIIRQRPPTAKGTCFATLEDEDGFLDVIFHKTVYEKWKEVLLGHAFLIVSGKLQKEGHSVSLLAKGLKPLPGAEPPSLRLPRDYPVRPSW